MRESAISHSFFFYDLVFLPKPPKSPPLDLGIPPEISIFFSPPLFLLYVLSSLSVLFEVLAFAPLRPNVPVFLIPALHPLPSAAPS